jgi:electron transfer flavoprotein beta subunit
MKILVCINIVPDSTSRIKLNPNHNAIDFSGIQWIINPWDELALTRSIELKDESKGAITEVVVLHVGPKENETVIRKALAMGADSAIRIDSHPTDSLQTAKFLASEISKTSFSLILCGNESSDYNGSAVGPMLAELLDLPLLSGVSGLYYAKDSFVTLCAFDNLQQSVRINEPCVAIVHKGIALAPRIATMRGIMTARNKNIHLVNPEMINSDTKTISVEKSKPRQLCRLFATDNIDELVTILHTEANIL